MNFYKHYPFPHGISQDPKLSIHINNTTTADDHPQVSGHGRVPQLSSNIIIILDDWVFKEIHKIVLLKLSCIHNLQQAFKFLMLFGHQDLSPSASFCPTLFLFPTKLWHNDYQIMAQLTKTIKQQYSLYSYTPLLFTFIGSAMNGYLLLYPHCYNLLLGCFARGFSVLGFPCKSSP